MADAAYMGALAGWNTPELSDSSNRPVSLNQLRHFLGVERSAPHESVEAPNRVVTLTIAANVECCASWICDGKASDGGDFIVAHSVHPNGQSLLSSSLVDEDLDRFVVVDPFGAVECGGGQPGHHAGTVSREPRT